MKLIKLMISARAPFTSQAAYDALNDGEVKAYKHPSGKMFYVMDSIEIEQSRKTKQAINVSQEQNNMKINAGFLEKMLEDNARRKHSGILANRAPPCFNFAHVVPCALGRTSRTVSHLVRSARRRCWRT